jgi:hypothetical protein
VFDASDYWITVVELPSFDDAAVGLLTPEEVDGFIAYVAKHPDDGEVIPDTGGLRKLPWPAAKGRCGARVIYYFRDLNMPVYLLTALGPGERCRFNKQVRAQMRLLIDELVAQQWRSQVAPLVTTAMRPIR